jgi:HK97 family phage major capsid protein
LPLRAGGGRQTFPNLLGNLKFYAVTQGNSAKASRFLFSGLTIEDKKWMTYVPWTYEMGQLMGQELVDIIIRKLGEARSQVIDDVVINGDGTALYHTKTGIVARAGVAAYPEVRMSTATATRTTFGAIKEDDFLAAQLNLAPSVRDGGVYMLHSDWKIRLKNLKDGEGRPLYLSGGAVSLINGEFFIHGAPVRFSEFVPNVDGGHKVYGLFVNPRYVALGSVPGVVAEAFNTGTIPDADNGEVNLLADDAQALRAKIFFDFELSQVTSKSGANDLGAFTVLRTANA